MDLKISTNHYRRHRSKEKKRKVRKKKEKKKRKNGEERSLRHPHCRSLLKGRREKKGGEKKTTTEKKEKERRVGPPLSAFALSDAGSKGRKGEKRENRKSQPAGSVLPPRKRGKNEEKRTPRKKKIETSFPEFGCVRLPQLPLRAAGKKRKKKPNKKTGFPYPRRQHKNNSRERAYEA